MKVLCGIHNEIDKCMHNYFEEMLQKAQEFFGDRDANYHEIEIWNDPSVDSPHISYKNRNGVDYEQGKIGMILKINHKRIDNKQNRIKDLIERSCFQMSHETVHLIAPTTRKDVCKLEEGVACWFTIYCIRNNIGKYTNHYKDLAIDHIRNDEYYGYSHILVLPMFHRNKYFIKHLREDCESKSKYFHDISKMSIRNMFSEDIISSVKIDDLLSKFNT